MSSVALHNTLPQDACDFRLDAMASNTVKAARFGCIFFMCFVHIFGQQYIATPTILTAKSIILDVFGRASVPLLSAISGYLAVVTLAHAPLRDIATKKLTSLIIPMVFWNILVIIFGIILFTTLSVTTSFYEHIQARNLFEILTQSVLSLNYEGVQTSHNFLRDVFVCFLLFPLIHKTGQLVGRGPEAYHRPRSDSILARKPPFVSDCYCRTAIRASSCKAGGYVDGLSNN